MSDAELLRIELGLRVMLRLESHQRDMRWWKGLWR
jgi:hypothetical protein